MEDWNHAGFVSLIKSGPHRSVYRICLPNLDLHLKHNRIQGFKTWIREWGRVPKASKEYQIALHLKKLAIPAIEPLAFGTRGGLRPDSFLLTRTLPLSRPLDAVFLDSLNHGKAKFKDMAFLIRSLAKFIAVIHQKGIIHRDFHLGNILLSETVPGTLGFFLVDLEPLAIGERPVPWDKRVLNLAVLNCWADLHLPRSWRYCFWQSYLREVQREKLPQVFAEDREWRRFQLKQMALLTAGVNRKLWNKFDGRCLGVNRRFRKIQSGCFHGHVSALVPMGEIEKWLEMARQEIPQGVVLKNSRSSLVVDFNPSIGVGQSLIFKKFKAKEWLDPLAALFRPDGATRSWTMGNAMLHRLLPTPRPLAVWHRWKFGLPQDGFLVSEKVAGAMHLLDWLSHLRTFPEEIFVPGVRVLIDRLGDLIRRMHDRGISHRDLKAPNLLVNGKAIDPKLWFIDLVGVQKHGSLGEKRKMQNLARLNVSFLINRGITHSDRLRFLRQYLKWGLEGPFTWKKWWREISKLSLFKMEKNRLSNRPLA